MFVDLEFDENGTGIQPLNGNIDPYSRKVSNAPDFYHLTYVRIAWFLPSS